MPKNWFHDIFINGLNVKYEGGNRRIDILCPIVQTSETICSNFQPRKEKCATLPKELQPSWNSNKDIFGRRDPAANLGSKHFLNISFYKINWPPHKSFVIEEQGKGSFGHTLGALLKEVQ